MISMSSAEAGLFLLMNLSEKENIAESTLKQEDERTENENRSIAEVANQIVIKNSENVIIKENIKAE